MTEVEKKKRGSGSEGSSNKDLNDWLPITSSRNAKWYYSAFHNVTAMVGAGVLGLPYAMSQLGWYVSLLPLHYCKIICLETDLG